MTLLGLGIDQYSSTVFEIYRKKTAEKTVFSSAAV